MYKKPELLSPAGNLEKCQIALTYGADAVYIGGHVFGLRKYADNFTASQMRAAISFAHERSKKVYVVLNGFAHDVDISHLKAHLLELEALQPDALIVSDLGVFRLAKSLTSIPLHVSTQASVTNTFSCEFWKKEGASRIILAREVSLSECAMIKKNLDIELEVFIHGSMCASYSGKCVISNYTAGRDSNRGGCVQSCRHEYEIFSDTSEKQNLGAVHVMNAKDLMGLSLLQDMMKVGIDSVKIEGRMKSNLYTANVSSCYRFGIDSAYDALCSGNPLLFEPESLKEQLGMVSNRQFSEGGLSENAFADSINYEFDAYEKTIEFLGTVQDVYSDGFMIVEVKHGFLSTDSLYLFHSNGSRESFLLDAVYSLDGASLSKTKPNSFVKLKAPPSVSKYSLLYKKLT